MGTKDPTRPPFALLLLVPGVLFRVGLVTHLLYWMGRRGGRGQCCPSAHGCRLPVGRGGGECGGTQTPIPAHPTLARIAVLSAIASVEQCRGMLIDTGGTGTFWSGVGSPQCTVRVMSVVPSLQRGVMNGADAAPVLALGTPGCGAVVGGLCSKLRTDIALRCQRGTSLLQTVSGCSHWRGWKGRGVRALSGCPLPIAHCPLPTAPCSLPTAAPAIPVVSQRCIEPAG